MVMQQEAAPEHRFEITVQDDAMHRECYYVVHAITSAEANLRARKLAELTGANARVMRVQEIYQPVRDV